MNEGWTLMIPPEPAHIQVSRDESTAGMKKGAKSPSANASILSTNDVVSVMGSISSGASRPNTAPSAARRCMDDHCTSSVSSTRSKGPTVASPKVNAYTASDILLGEDAKARIKERNDAFAEAREARLEKLKAKERSYIRASTTPTSTLRAREKQESRAAELIEKQMQLELLQRKQAQVRM
jgi:hypothetical protein